MRRHPAAGFTLPRRAERGFTLIEIVVVLAILGLVLAVVLPNLGPSTETVELRAAASELRALLRSTRSSAITANRDLVIVIDDAGRSFVLDGARQPFRSTGFAEQRLHVEPPGKLVFYATGGASGGRLTIRSRRAEQVLEIDSVSGQVALAP
jgi:type II secretion system protein H